MTGTERREAPSAQEGVPADVAVQQAVDTRSQSRSGITMLVNLAFTAGAGFAYWFFVARTYSADDVGRAGALATSAMLVIFATNLGLTVAVGRHASTRGSDDSARFTVAALLVVLSSAIGGLLLFALGPDSVMRALRGPAGLSGEIVFLVIVALVPLSQLSDIRLLALRRWRFVLLRSGTSAALKITIALILTSGSADHGTVTLFVGLLGPDAVLGLISACIVGATGARHMFTTRGLPPLRAAFNAARINYVSVLLAQGANVVVPFVVISHVTDAENANFYLAWSFTQIALLVPQSITWGLHVEGRVDADVLARQVSRALRLAIGLSAVATLGSIALVWVLPTLYGSDYETAGRIAPVMMATSVPYAVSAILLAQARVTARYRTELRIAAVYAVSLVGSVLLLVGDGGLSGAVTGVVLGAAVAALVNGALGVRHRSTAGIPVVTPHRGGTP
jgi:O-antigen/teichoic acid export membrane protein